MPKHIKSNVNKESHYAERVENAASARKKFFHILTMLLAKLFPNCKDNIAVRSREQKKRPSQQETSSLGHYKVHWKPQSHKRR